LEKKWRERGGEGSFNDSGLRDERRQKEYRVLTVAARAPETSKKTKKRRGKREIIKKGAPREKWERGAICPSDPSLSKESGGKMKEKINQSLIDRKTEEKKAKRTKKKRRTEGIDISQQITG